MPAKNNLFTNPWVAMGLPALTLLFGIQILKALFPLLLYNLGDYRGWSSINIGLLALVFFSLSFLAEPVRRLLGARILLIVSVLIVCFARLALQFWPRDPNAYLFLCLIGVVGLVWFFPVYLAALRAQDGRETARFGLGLQIGLILVVALSGLANSYELNWQPGLLSGLAVVILAGLQLGCLAGMHHRLPPVNQDEDPPLATALSWAAIGPFLFGQMLLFTNIATIAAGQNWALPLALAIALAGGVLGFLGAIFAYIRGAGRWEIIIGGVVFLVLMLLGANSPALQVAFLLLAPLLLGEWLMVILLGLRQGHGRYHSIRNLTLGNGLGWVLFVIFIFLFYASYQLPLLPNNILPPVAYGLIFLWALLAVGRLPRQAHMLAAPVRWSFGGFVLILAMLVLFKFLTWQTFAAVPAAGGPVRVLNYNLHNGVNPYGLLDLEAVARAIEAEDPDVVALQEVSRGWIINGSTDMLQWLGQRLGMPYVWGSTEGGTWGNAVFSRYPILTAETGALPPDDLLLHRGYILVQIDTGTAVPLHLINTHYHHLEADSDIRVEQTEALLAFWNGREHTLIVGDLNAGADVPEMQMLGAAGFIDAINDAGITPNYTYSSIHPDRQLDYIWYTADLQAAEVRITTATASDHLGVAATISLP